MKRRLVISIVLFLCLLSGAGFCNLLVKGSSGAETSTVAAAIPDRPENAMTGSAFAKATRGLAGWKRQKMAVAEILKGNIPDFLRKFKTVRLLVDAKEKGAETAEIAVMADYMAIGSNEDFLRIPLTYPSAVTVAKAFGCILPTRKIVDAVYEQADCRLTPITMEPGPMMRSSQYYIKHQRMIEAQRNGCPPDALIAGHKKDVVITNRLWEKPNRISIFGWHRGVGDPIQPLSIVHYYRYADYSHGVRLVRETAMIDGRPVNILSALQNPETAGLFSYEGTIKRPRALLGRESK